MSNLRVVLGTPKFTASWSEVSMVLGPQNLWLVSEREVFWRMVPLHFMVCLNFITCHCCYILLAKANLKARPSLGNVE